jgi:hypothetical protein
MQHSPKRFESYDQKKSSQANINVRKGEDGKGQEKEEICRYRKAAKFAKN